MGNVLRLTIVATAALTTLGCEPHTPQESGPARAPTTTPSVAPVDSAPPAPPIAPSASAQPNAKLQTLHVHEQLVDCEGEAPRKCMQVRKTADGEWEWFYDAIVGFEHEPGYRYELRVEVTEVADPPADGSSLSYKLLEVVSKTKVTPGTK